MSTEYTHFSKLSFDNLFARGSDGHESLVMDSAGNLTVSGLTLTGSLSLTSLTVSGSTVGGNATFNGVIIGSAANRVSGLSTIKNGSGVLTLPTSTDTLLGRDTVDTLTQKSISGSANTITNLTNSSIASNAAIDFSKLATLTSTNILLGSAGGVATSTPVTGDVTISNTGVTAIGASKVTNAMLAGSIAYSKLSLTGSILNADLAGSIAYSKLALTGAILNADLAGSIAYSKLSLTGSLVTGDLASGFILPSAKGGTGVNNTGSLTYGANNITVTTSGVTSITVPTSGTMATLAGVEALTNKDHQGGTASNTSRITVPKDTKTNLDGLTRKQGTIVYSTTLDKLYTDDGSTLNSVARDTPWVAAGAIPISGSTSNPTKGTTTTDQIYWRRVGDSMEIRIEYLQTAAGSSGSGTYLIQIPNSQTIDTNKCGIVAGGNPSRSLGAGILRSNTTYYNLYAMAYDSTHVNFFSLTAGATPDVWQSGAGGLGNTTIIMGISFTVPITGW